MVLLKSADLKSAPINVASLRFAAPSLAKCKLALLRLALLRLASVRSALSRLAALRLAPLRSAPGSQRDLSLGCVLSNTGPPSSLDERYTASHRIRQAMPDRLFPRLEEGLVCDAIQPAMTHLVPLASAVVERRGGMLIHGAIIARELGIPCVNSIAGALNLVEDGELITVDGYVGIVTVGLKTATRAY